MWLRLAGASEVDAAHGLAFTDASLMIEAAVNGQDVALARSLPVDIELRQGRLIRLFRRA